MNRPKMDPNAAKLVHGACSSRGRDPAFYLSYDPQTKVLRGYCKNCRGLVLEVVDPAFVATDLDPNREVPVAPPVSVRPVNTSPYEGDYYRDGTPERGTSEP